MEGDRLNLPSTSTITIEVLGHELNFSQDPNSKHLGTTVWDASMVLIKYLERNCRKGRFCPSKLRGKRVIELGAGCGVAGFGLAMLGCHVISSDQKEVLPLLQRNVERNVSNIVQLNPSSDTFGSIKVVELDWGNVDHIQAVGPPFDYIVGTDVVYSEHLLEPLLQTIIALSGPRTTIMLGHEIRSTGVHEKMLNLWKRNFNIKTIPRSKMDNKYQHPSIQLYMMGFRPHTASTTERSHELDVVDDACDTETEERNGRMVGTAESSNDSSCERYNDECLAMGLQRRTGLHEWEVRRCGAMAARLLRDLKP